jgi:acetyl-CoA acetyltransferase
MQDELTLRRFTQYREADQEFRSRTLEAPVDVSVRRGQQKFVMADEGVAEASADRVRALKPVHAGGTVSYAGQTHPADGTAGLIVANRDMARQFSADRGVEVELVAAGQARADVAHMPEAPIPAARQALARAGIGIADVKAIKTHNPFIVNDWAFAKAFEIDPFVRMNNYGCSLVFGHPQAPTGMRLVVELIEELKRRGGGYGLFAGCAAGDTAMALVLKVH